MAEQKGKNSDEEIIRGIREHDRETLTELYRQLFPMVRILVKNLGGTQADAWDVFQETLGAIYDRIASEADSFKLNSSFTTFFFAVSKRVWYKHLRWRKVNDRFLQEETSNAVRNEDEKMDELIRENIMLNLVRRNLEKLKPDCRNLLEATMQGLKAEELTVHARVSTAAAVYNKRRNCIEKLFNHIKNDPDYFILKDYEKP